MLCLNRSALFVVSKVFQSLHNKIGGNYLVAVKYNEIVVIRSALKIVVDVSCLISLAIGATHDLDIFVLCDITVDITYIFGIAAVVKDNCFEIRIFLLSAYGERCSIEVIAGAV